jgi:prepilin-type processing-associated H-X9-DG protein
MARTATELLDALDTMFETVKIEQDKSVAKLHARTDADTITTAVKTLLPAVGASREAARRAKCVNNLKQIELALFNYESTYGFFPPTVLYGPDGKTTYSWRVAILPFLENADLYNQYKFDEPWDGPNNSKLIARMPAVFNCPDDDEGLASHFSSYFAPKGPDTLLSDRKEGTRIAEITDGTSNTIMIVEAKRPIPWTKPEDVIFADGMPKDAIGGLHPGGFNVGMGDGSVRFLRDTVNKVVLQALFSRSSGEVISSDSY